MASAALIFFGLAAMGGVALLILRLLKRELPLPLAMTHGSFAALGLVVLTIALGIHRVEDWATLPMVLFEIAALGGFFLFSFHLRKREIPVFLVVIHGALALSAFGIMIAYL